MYLLLAFSKDHRPCSDPNRPVTPLLASADAVYIVHFLIYCYFSDTTFKFYCLPFANIFCKDFTGQDSDETREM